MPHNLANRRAFAAGHEQAKEALPFIPDDAVVAKNIGLSQEMDAVLSAVRDALAPETFLASCRTTQSIPLRDAGVIVNTIHNPTANAVTISLSLDPGSEVVYSKNLAAGDTLVMLGLDFPRLAGFVSAGGGYVTLGGTLKRIKA